MKNFEKVEILKSKRDNNKKVESEKFEKLEILKSKRDNNKTVESEKFEKVEILKTKTFNTYKNIEKCNLKCLIFFHNIPR